MLWQCCVITIKQPPAGVTSVTVTVVFFTSISQLTQARIVNAYTYSPLKGKHVMIPQPVLSSVTFSLLFFLFYLIFNRFFPRIMPHLLFFLFILYCLLRHLIWCLRVALIRLLKKKKRHAGDPVEQNDFTVN